MSNFFLADRIKETSRTEGIGSIVLDGKVSGFSSFADFYASGDVVFYAITDNINYEIGSGEYRQVGSSRVLTRNPIRSSQIQVGPYYVEGTSNSGPTDGQNGFFYPVWLNKSAALSGIGFDDGPFTAVSGLTFDEHPGQTFYRITERANPVDTVGISGGNYATSGQPINFGGGLKEVFVTYPGKTAVYNGVGLDTDVKEPKHSGIAFWKNEQILNYDSELVWDDTNGFLGVNQPNPEYPIDVGGLVADSIVRASGFVDGGSGIAFSGGQLTDTLLTASGGTQLEPFLRNRKGTSANGVIELSGIVDQIIDFSDQSAATVFAGPASGACDPCPDGPPTFRQLVASDLPTSELQSDFGFVIQQDAGLDAGTQNTTATPFAAGMVALYSTSGNITYDSGIFYDATNNRLAVGKNASVDGAVYTLDVGGEGTLNAASGYFKQLIFDRNVIRVGDNTGEYADQTNLFVVNIGGGAGASSSGLQDVVIIGSGAGNTLEDADRIVAVGGSAGASTRYAEDLVGVGYKTLQLGSGLYNVVSLGSKSVFNADDLTDVVAVGKNAAAHAAGSDSLVVIGEEAGSGLNSSSAFIAMGKNVAQDASGVTMSVALGSDSLKGSSGVLDSIFVGEQSSSGSFDLSQVIAIGNSQILVESTGISKSTFIGPGAGRYTESLNNVIAIGQNAALSGLELERTIAVGGLAASNASGNFNTYIGQDAGIGVSGNNNIEIVSSGTNVSFLTHEASNKVNIAEIIVGDQSSHRVAVGKPDDASPNGTFVVRPFDADEAAFIIHHQGSGSATPYMVLQSGDGTSIYHVTNSGDVISSGFMHPSGGLKLDPHLPDSITNKLYNEGGTLKWNGTAVAVGGGFTSFDLRAQIDNTADSGVEITTGQTILFSGIHVDTQIDSGNRQIIVDAGTLSGVLQNQITNSLYTFDAVASGVGSNNNSPKQMDDGAVLAMSGVSGVTIDFDNQTDGTNSSGIFVIGYNPDSDYTFNMTAGTTADDIISNGQTVTISGVSGVTVDYNPDNQFFTIGPNELSGVLSDTIDNSGNYLLGQIQENTTSGIAISGVAEWASGEFARAGLTQTLGTSGLITQDGFHIMDPNGSGNLKHLNFPNNGGRIIIRADEESLGSFQGGVGSIIIGSGAGTSAANTVDDYVTAIGPEAFGGNQQGSRSSMVILGHNAFVAEPVFDTDYSIAVGWQSLAYCSGQYNVAIGYQAGQQASSTTATRTSEKSVDIGYGAGYGQHYSSGEMIDIGMNAGYNQQYSYRNINIGRRAGDSCEYHTSSISLGENAGFNSDNMAYCINLGYSAGSSSVHAYDTISIGRSTGDSTDFLEKCVFIGDNAGTSASGDSTSNLATNIVAIGTNAGRQTHLCDNSIFIGPYAGDQCKGMRNSISLSNRSAAASRDFLFADDHDVSLLDIGFGIQGSIQDVGAHIHVGLQLDNYGTANGRDIDDIRGTSALTLTPVGESEHALKLNLHPEDGNIGDSDQLNSLLRTEYRPLGAGATTKYSATNEIINKFGMLRIPKAFTSTGTGSSTQLVDGLSNEIPREDGTIAMYASTTLGTGIAFVQNNVWYKIDSTTTF
tara:strand:+ start:2928 stop:7649 length:4722 start_codon:yes stop_codon:yes gene_type:complete